jgi:hypothetical protein
LSSSFGKKLFSEEEEVGGDELIFNAEFLKKASELELAMINQRDPPGKSPVKSFG